MFLIQTWKQQIWFRFAPFGDFSSLQDDLGAPTVVGITRTVTPSRGGGAGRVADLIQRVILMAPHGASLCTNSPHMDHVASHTSSCCQGPPYSPISPSWVLKIYPSFPRVVQMGHVGSSHVYCGWLLTCQYYLLCKRSASQAGLFV